MSNKPSVVKGTRDFLPDVMAKRNYIFDTIKSSFVKYGFLPIETPAMETTQTLMGKYGEEGDRLIFKIMPRGDKLKQDKDISKLAEEALRYDLTVPFARFVVQNQNEITFPFKRYQIQPVWRADKPQKGRYREFYQCDADVVGSDSLVYEIELVQIFDEVLSNLGIPDFSIKINNRKILSGIAGVCGEEENIIPITIAIDKLDKIGKDGVIKELEQRGISSNAIEKIDPLFALSGSNEEKLKQMADFLSDSEIGTKGVEELSYVIEEVNALGLSKAKLEFEVTLARGLNYYTGAIFEVTANNVKIGSICGGGRYDDLTSLFGLKGVSGVGISFGADRIYDVMNELDLFPKSALVGTKVMFVNFGEAEQKQCMKYAKELRDQGIPCEVYPSAAKMKKQMKYADDRKIPFVVMIGSEELKNGTITYKNMESGTQETANFIQLVSELK
ncbi:histidine--tRNA ligase [Paracrocinitomix mangrovi]|uniref:histidine--tRNA ligase n=1 Tax=Paracrocinitomix mangrovi TaxID=2862509 RepID=UPI001C8E767C|nr:histidine--tRNA ligase [Paracrocinitomix mangrovi]UKN01801.1 histidine--tRNA ligase [Paracrocinitomix mangrovi]